MCLGHHLLPTEIDKLAGTACRCFADVACWWQQLHRKALDQSKSLIRSLSGALLTPQHGAKGRRDVLLGVQEHGGRLYSKTEEG